MITGIFWLVSGFMGYLLTIKKTIQAVEEIIGVVGWIGKTIISTIAFVVHLVFGFVSLAISLYLKVKGHLDVK